MTRDRGTYGPPVPAAEAVLGWGAQQAADYTKARAFVAVTDPFVPAVDKYLRAAQGARRLSVGTRLLSDVDKPREVIGADLFHGSVDRTRAVSMITTGFQALATDLRAWMETADQSDKGVPATFQWIAADFSTTLQEWDRFVQHETRSWWSRAAISWNTFLDWDRRLRQLRGLARAHGILLESSEPPALPKTILEHSESGSGSEPAAMLGVLKISAAAIMTIMGAAGLFVVARELFRRKRAYPVDTLETVSFFK